MEERKISASDVIRRLQPELAKISGITLFMQPVQDLSVETRVSRTQYQFSLEDPDVKELSEWAPKLVERLQALPELRDVATDQQNLGLQTRVVIDRDTASRLGITPQMIDDALYDAYGQRQISIMFTQLNQYRVVLEVKPDFQHKPQDLGNVYIRSASGGKTPLSAFTEIQQTYSPLSVNHQGQFPVVTISFNLAPHASLGEAVEAIDAVKADLGLPASIQANYQGTAEAFRASLSNEPILILAALVTVYIVLGVLYESYIHPVTILSTLPSAGVGALVALLLCRTDLSVIAFIGIILLIGIVKKNAIMMIDFALEAEPQAGDGSAQRHLPGVHVAIPADHDDHDGRAPGRRAVGIGHGHWFGTATPVGYHDHRWIDFQSNPDAVYDAGDLSLVRPHRQTTWQTVRSKLPKSMGRTNTTPRRSHERLDSVYSQAGWHHVADDRRDDGGCVGILSSAGFAAAAGRFSDHLSFCGVAGRQS